MKRPIPEGVTPPEGCTILGWGGEFLVPENGFTGFVNLMERSCMWFPSIKLCRGRFPKCLYAAPAESEVARLNRTSLENDTRWHEVVNHGIEKEGPPTTNPPQISTSVVGERDKIPDILPHIIQSGFAMTNREEDIARQFFERGWKARML